MAILYLASLEKGSGKTAVCAGIGRQLLNDGKKVGFFKPSIAGGADSDTSFIKSALSLEEAEELLSPAFSNDSELKSKVKEACSKISRGKDVVLVEEVFEQRQASPAIVEALDAKVIIVEGYSKGPLKASTYKDFGGRLLGVIVNKVPQSRLEQVRQEVSAELDKNKISLLGVLPEDKTLLALTIGELANHIQGEILSGVEKSSELVENIMLGALTVDSGLDYYGRKNNKAVVLKGERTDMQLAALETPCRCLVITGNIEPRQTVLTRVEEKNVPVILTRDDSTTVVTKIEGVFDKARFNQEKKLPRLGELMKQNFDFATLYKGLGLAS